MEYIESYSLMNASLDHARGTVTIGSGRVVESRSSVIQHIRDLQDSSEKWADDRITVVWTQFRSGSRMVEKCAMEWYSDGRRMCDVVWVKRNYKWM